MADPDASAASALHRSQRLRDQAPSRYPQEGPDHADLPASGRCAARPRHDDLQDFADGRLRVEILWPGQGEDPPLPAEHGLRVRRYPSGLFDSEVELARARGDLGASREAAPVDSQHLLPRVRASPRLSAFTHRTTLTGREE